jgi:hypothetical protein
MDGICKLCGEASSEIRNSHIIPEFNYSPCYDEKHRFFKLSSTASRHQTYEQKGLREYMLCQKCETKFSVWEGYAKRILSDDGLHLINKNEFGYTLGGADYEHFKLYGMSVLWRMGMSRLPLFEEVRLGPHEERLRVALQAADPLEPHEYPFWTTAVTLRGKFHADFIVQPTLVKIDGYHVYRCVISGILYSFFVGSHRVSPGIEDLALTRKGVLKVPVMSIEDIPFLHEHIVQIANRIKAEVGAQNP